ncbi:alpha/beta hydrolase [Streptomyces reniochalinae]|uniref:Alpha/beta hydrolase n=1 Tax=Streptomyces reniochalinae TaxID=2250578 RepID=A0A367E8T2_9ACTN|nr:alpha/beta hydrolase [Streptomyces reniochalinae]RCG14189.1 alpha/beta hydrolase [Streptomyces reniochalinae]
MSQQPPGPRARTARGPRRVAAAVLAVTALVLAGCSSEDGSDSPGSDPSGAHAGADAPPLKPLSESVPENLRPYYNQKLSWRSCGVEGFECASLRVPLDYDEPGDGPDDTGHSVRLAVTRSKPQGGGGKPKGGSLHVNPGGPGGSAIDYVQQAAGLAYPPQVRDHYTLVGMDPRGVGHSEPVECLSDKQMDSYTRVDQTPDSAKETDALTAAYERFAKGCKKRSGKLLGHVSTTEAARDMDVLRGVLGDKQLNYVGASYGTYLGATYAGLFPKRSGRMVLDGAMDPSLSARRVNREQTAGFETAFKAFAKDCVGRSDCPLGTGGVSEAGEELGDFFEKVDRKPLKTGSSRPLTESLATSGVIRAMYDEGSWPQLREALAAAKKGDGAPLLALSDDYYERGPDGEYSNIMYANPAVNCLDAPPAFSDAAAARKAVPSFEKASPVFGRNFAWAALNCAKWPVKPTGEPHRIAAEGADPIVVVGTTRDPATPYRWAQGLAGQLSSARLVTYEGDGHTAYLRGSDCVDSAVTSYLVQGKPPKNGTTCH